MNLSEPSGEPVTLVPREKRFPVVLSIELMRLPDEFAGSAQIVDLNASGMCVESMLELQEFDGCGVEIPGHPAAGGRMSIFAEVRWRERIPLTNSWRYGLKVGGMLPHHRERMRRLISTLKSDASVSSPTWH